MAYAPYGYRRRPYVRRAGPNPSPTGGAPPPFPSAPNPPASGPPAPYRPTPSPNRGPSTVPSQAPPGQAPGAAGRPPIPFPLDPGYTVATGANQQQYDTTLAGLAYQQQRAGQDYGFGDPSNPFNQAAMLERAYHQSQAGTLNQGAARGQLYSGATQSNLDEGGYQYQRSYADLRRRYEDVLQGIAQQRAQAGAAYASGQAGAYGDALQRQLANPPEDPGAASKQGSDPAGGKSLASKLWKAGKGHGPKWQQVIDMLGYDPRTPNGLKFRT